ncbi:ABC transporter ATP-binding protein [Clostridia bacterium]|nr:ABC transporter ATP-binding protein [Clostridia bacterium]
MIAVTNLTKKYGGHTAVNDVSFTVNEGEIVGFLGPNGAGKTTTMNVLTGYISATAGTVKIDGYDILDEPERAKANLGYMPDNPPLYPDMLVNEYLSFVCDIKGVKRAEREAMLSSVMKTVKIFEVRKRLIKNLSKGYRQRVGLAQALLGKPKALILDEPTVGLDPKQIVEMRDVIKGLGKNHTVILSSHILPEVSAVCDRIIIINKGAIVASGTTAELSDTMTAGHKMTVRVKGDQQKIAEAFSAVPNAIKSAVSAGSRESGTVDFEIEGAGESDVREVIFNALSKANLPLLQMKPLNYSLEDIFLQITGGGIRA